MKVGGAVVLAAVVAGLAALSTVRAQERKIKREDLPAAVQQTVAEQSKDAKVKGFSTEVEKGKTLYEAELVVQGHSRDILMDAQGNIVEIEEEVAMDALPAAVKEGLAKAARSGTISRVESLTKNGKLVAYEAVVKTGAKRSEVQVGPDGQKLAHSE
ncbi:MAG TPA: hypothetical protein VH110_07080 [Candidatus Acidoferrum sp.]|jgi:hypothetical protein|nr:hypothetical protein [Candidatus Acidoferrum sp.]